MKWMFRSVLCHLVKRLLVCSRPFLSANGRCSTWVTFGGIAEGPRYLKVVEMCGQQIMDIEGMGG